MNALSLEVISNPILRATIRDIMERVYGVPPAPGQMELVNTFPGSKPNCNESLTAGLRSGALAKRPLDAAIPATGAGQLSRVKSGENIERLSSLNERLSVSGATYGATREHALQLNAVTEQRYDTDCSQLSERTEEAKGRPDARDALREDGIRIPCNESLAQRAEKNQAPRAV